MKVKHEIDAEPAQRADVLATDSPAQLRAYPEPHLLEETPSWDRVVDLAEMVAGKADGRTHPALPRGRDSEVGRHLALPTLARAT